MVSVAVPSAGTRVGGRHKRDGTGELSLPMGAAHAYHSFIQGLAQLIQDCPGKFREFIEKRLGLMFILFCVLLIGGFVLLKFVQ